MADIFQAIVLGAAQGVGEFLPISSTAHLVLVPYFFGWKDPGLAFDVALHFGTLIAVAGYFWKDWVYILKIAFNKITNYKLQITNDFLISNDIIFESRYPSKLLWLLVIATIPGVMAGYFLESYAENALRHPLIIALALAFVGSLLYFADKFLKHKKEIKDITFAESLFIGIAQAVAIIPGVSRSGATITAGLWLGFSREAAARFSFLLSTPIIFGATIAKLPDFFSGTFEIAPLIVGVFVSAVTGYWAIAFLLKFIQKSGYALFFWYRLILALIIAVVYFLN